MPSECNFSVGLNEVLKSEFVNGYGDSFDLVHWETCNHDHWQIGWSVTDG